MKVSYEEIGRWTATFACTSAVEGHVVKISSDGTVAACADGDAFCGTVVSVGHDGTACSVALGGVVTAAYTGTAPTVGWAALSANSTGGVKADAAGRSHLIAEVDTSAKTVTFVL